MQLNKTVIIITTAAVFLIILVAVFFIAKDYSGREVKEEGPVDCGRSLKTLDDFGNPFFDVDFDEDEAFSCMGRSINNDCFDSKMAIDDKGVDFIYKISGKECVSRIELEDPERGVIFTECPISSLVSFAKEQSETVQDFKMITDKIEQGEGDFAATIFALTALSLTLSNDDFERLGCSSNNQ